MTSPPAALLPTHISVSWSWLSDSQAFPPAPGVYLFLATDGTVLYVGKAKNLKKRIAQYRQLPALPPLKQQLVQRAVTVVYQTTVSELEALLLEAELIRLYQPAHNILLKDDRSPLYIVITNDAYPRVLTARRQSIVKGLIAGEIFGPYQSGYMARQVLQVVRPAFAWCNQAGKQGLGVGRGTQLGVKPRFKTSGQPVDKPFGKPPAKPPAKPRACFYHHLGLCSGACVGLIEPKPYRAMIGRLKKFLRGQTKSVERQLKKQIRLYAQEQRYEDAARARNELAAITALTDPTYRLRPDPLPVATQVASTQAAWENLRQRLAAALGQSATWSLTRIEGFDVSNFTGKYAAVSMVVFTNGQPDLQRYRLFNIRTKDTPDDYFMMREALTRRQRHAEWGWPDLVLIDGGRGQVAAVQSIWQWEIPVVGIAKNPDRLVVSRPDGTWDFYPLADWGRAGQIVQQVRDEAHRFAKKQARRRLQNRDEIT